MVRTSNSNGHAVERVGAVATMVLMMTCCTARLAYNTNGDILDGTDIGAYCQTNTRICMTNFEKNVFASDNPMMDRDWTLKLFPDIADQFDDEHTCGTGSKMISMDTCSQIHCPQTLAHPQGELKASYVQEQYGLKWDYAMSYIRENNEAIYDSFFDYSVAYWVADLTDYFKIWKEVNADIIYLKWEGVDNINGNTKTYYSLITHHGKGKSSTLVQYELISDTFSVYTNGDLNDDDIIMLESEQRAYIGADFMSYSLAGDGCNAYPIGARRSVSNLDKNVNFYTKMFDVLMAESNQIQTGEYTDYNGNTVRYAHILLMNNGDSASISFFERDNSASTYGEFTVMNFENKMNEVHNSVMVSPFCGFDRWFDMHYALDMGSNHYLGTKILENIMKSGSKYSMYSKGQIFLYIVEPNGHNVQFVFAMDSGAQMYVDINEWDNDWCQIECTDEQLAVGFGDDIFEWDMSDDVGMMGAENFGGGESILSSIFGKNLSKDGSMINGFVGFAVLLATGLMLVCLLKPFYDNCKNENLYQKIESTHDGKSIYGSVTNPPNV